MLSMNKTKEDERTFSEEGEKPDEKSVKNIVYCGCLPDVPKIGLCHSLNSNMEPLNRHPGFGDGSLRYR
jgi:hypothetical protein